MQHNRWHESNVDPTMMIELQDLTSILSNIDDIKFELSYGSFIDINEKRITASTLWETTTNDIRLAGYKSDLYLRAIGTLYHTDIHMLQTFVQQTEKLQSFATQLMTLLEDIRLQQTMTHLRPGTTNVFSVRESYLSHYFSTQRQVSVTRGLPLEELFCMIYLTLHANNPDQHFSLAHDRQLMTLDQIKFDLYDIFSATSTNDVINIVTKVMMKLIDYETDMKTVYFTSPIFELMSINREQTLFDQLTRTDDVASYDGEHVDEDDADYMDETFSTWHDEHKNEGRKETFLQMDLDVGTKTNLTGGQARETESGDQVFATAQGTSQKSNQQDYSTRETIEQYDNKYAGQKNVAPYGDENINAVKQMKWAGTPSTKDIQTYNTYVKQIEPYKKKLSSTIEKILEHKKQSPRSHLHYGRLSKNLLPIVLDEHPRLFYKKDEKSREFDAIFTLMVDCSASMDQKMDETKKGIVLFHNILKDLKIPHQIVGFWEEATFMNDEQYPNYFHMIHSFTDSLYENNGAKIMQLRAEEDNRDGYSIRVIVEKMMERREKDKFLLVFSDGEPAATNYDDNGIVDTHLAVLEARKKGINVIGMYLADGNVHEHEHKLMKNIYGRERVMIPDVAELPDLFTPVLKKLLLNML